MLKQNFGVPFMVFVPLSSRLALASAALVASVFAPAFSTAAEDLKQDSLFLGCYTLRNPQPAGEPFYPVPPEIPSAHAELLKGSSEKFVFHWEYATDFAKTDGTGAPITDVATDGEVLTIRYDWNDGVLKLRPITKAISPIITRYQGTWTQSDGKASCIVLDLPVPDVWRSTIGKTEPRVLALGTIYAAGNLSADWPIHIGY